MFFKLQIVQEIERGILSTTEATKKNNIQCSKTVVNCLRKQENFDQDKQTLNSMQKTPEKRMMELKAEVKLVEKQKALLERHA